VASLTPIGGVRQPPPRFRRPFICIYLLFRHFVQHTFLLVLRLQVGPRGTYLRLQVGPRGTNSPSFWISLVE
ncbi:MAG: hypothetical protein ACK53Y_07785, partial [bacterium]